MWSVLLVGWRRSSSGGAVTIHEGLIHMLLFLSGCRGAIASSSSGISNWFPAAIMNSFSFSIK
jgi:hypothetical protein